MVRNKNPARSKKRKFEQPRQKPQKKPKFSYANKPAYLKEREARYKELPKKLEPPPIQEKRNWRNLRDESSEDEEEDPLKVLLGTFDSKIPTKSAIVSESESEDDVQDEGKKELEYEDDDDDDDNDDNSGDEENFGKDIKQQGNLEDIEDEKKDAKNKQLLKSPTLEDIEEEEVIIRYEEEGEEEDLDLKTEYSDPFSLHFLDNLSDDLYKSLSTTSDYETHTLNWPILGNIVCQIPTYETSKTESTTLNKKPKISLVGEIQFAKPGTPPTLISSVDWKNLYVKPQISVNISKVNYENIKDTLESDKSPLTSLQKEIFSLINNYQDLFYPQRTFSNAEQIRLVYCVHAINHVLKTRAKIMRHNLKLSKSKSDQVPDEFRDQGLVRPKVLIIVPFRDSCLKIVQMLIGLTIDEEKGGSVMNKKRFMEEFSGGEIMMPKRNPKPEDYELTFKGNSDDSFRIGIQVTKKVLKLYSDFYSSDIIVASPLGLRTLIGAEGELDRDYDYLASIEIMILDQAEVFMMQNWDHFIHLMDHLHLQPKTLKGTDFSRVRSWAVNGWTKYYR